MLSIVRFYSMRVQTCIIQGICLHECIFHSVSCHCMCAIVSVGWYCTG